MPTAHRIQQSLNRAVKKAIKENCAPLVIVRNLPGGKREQVAFWVASVPKAWAPEIRGMKDLKRVEDYPQDINIMEGEIGWYRTIRIVGK